MKQFRLLTLLALLLTAATGAWAQDAKHLITATYREQTRSLEQPLPYATTIGELYEAVSGESFSYLMSGMSDLGMPLTGITSNNTSVVIGEFNGASTPVTVKADGEATISIKFGSYALGIFVSATSPLYAYMKDGVKDADKWTVKVGDGEAQALPIGGLKGDGSETVTLQYTGRLKVKGVKATSDEKQAAKTPATVTTAPTGAAIVGVGKTTALVSGGAADGGTLWYAVTTTNTKPASTDGFSATVPTAETITASGKVYVWYYVKGDDTHSDSEIAGPVSVTVTPALSLTNPVVGQVIGSDGKNYAAASVPSGVTKVAMIAYVSGSNGLAITLADEGEKNWATAKSTCEAKTPAFTNGTWHLPTQAEWNQMFSANGGNAESYNGLNAAINTAGGTTLQSGFYWSSSEYSPGIGAHLVHLDDGDADWSKANETLVRKVRACLAF